MNSSCARPNDLIVSDFAAAEVASALSRLVRMDRLTTTEAAERLADFDDWRAGATELADMDAHDCRLANTYVRRFDLKLRAPDALHAAICRPSRSCNSSRWIAASPRRHGNSGSMSVVPVAITQEDFAMSDELVFYTNPMSRGRIVRWMLEEVGPALPHRAARLRHDDEGARVPGDQSDGQGAGAPPRRHGRHRVPPRSAPIWPMRFPPPDWRRRTVTGCAGHTIAGCSSPPARWRRRGPTRRWASPCRRNASGWPATATSPR